MLQRIGNVELNYCELNQKVIIKLLEIFHQPRLSLLLALISNDSEVLIKNVGLNETRSGLLKVLQMMGADIQIIQSKEVCNEKVGDILS